MGGPKERQWLTAAKAGDRTAFDRLAVAVEPIARRFAAYLIGASHETDDIVQDALIALHRSLERIEPDMLRPFVLRVVRNRCYGVLRERSRFAIVPLDAGGDDASSIELADAAPDPADTVAWAQMYIEVQRALYRLPLPQREALILRCLEGLSIAEIAETTRSEPGTVKSRIHYGRRQLRRMVHPAIIAAIDTGRNKHEQR